jgi:hypothetical protein
MSGINLIKHFFFAKNGAANKLERLSADIFSGLSNIGRKGQIPSYRARLYKVFCLGRLWPHSQILDYPKKISWDKHSSLFCLNARDREKKSLITSSPGGRVKFTTGQLIRDRRK